MSLIGTTVLRMGRHVVDMEENMQPKTAQHTPKPFLSLSSGSYRIQKSDNSCGCYLWDDDSGPGGRGGGVQFFMCVLHAAAPELRQEIGNDFALFVALETYFECQDQSKEVRALLSDVKTRIRATGAAIAKAEGR